MSQDRRASHFWSAVRAELPLLVGVFPFGMIYGVLALEAGLSPSAAQAMSSIIFAGSSQLITTQLVAEGAPGLMIVLTILVVNLRHALYSATIAPFTRPLKAAWKGVLAYLLTDEAFVVSILHYQGLNGSQEAGQIGESRCEENELQSRSGNEVKPGGHRYYLGAGLALWITWQVSTAVGVFLGTAVPSEWPLDFIPPLTFIAMVTPALKDRPAIVAALCAGVVALFAYSLPYRLGIILAALVGILAGIFLERRR